MLTKQFANWQFRLAKASKTAPESAPQIWTPSHSPDSAVTEIFPDLIHHSLIPDPFVDKNESLVQWVGYQTWEYRSTVEVTETNGKKVDLVLNGLDTFADVFFNDELVISTDNMFVKFSTPVTPVIGANEVRIVFRSVFDVEQPYDAADLLGGIKSRMFVRKAQYHYGWDWGPTLVTCGIYKPVELVIHGGEKLEGVHVDYEVKDVKNGEVSFEIKAETTGDIEVKYTLKKGSTTVWEGSSTSPSGALEGVELWYPHTHGTPALHTLEASTSSNTITTTVGFRKVELVEDPLATGTSFFFRVNGIDIYANGCNWIPASSFLTDLTEKDYYDWVRLTQEANQNMLRIWGGGVYEHEWFYQACDELGVMVWQDFMFACGQYPGDDKFVASVELEAKQNVQRLSNRPCVVIYAGNNEDYQTYEDKHIPDDEFYARKIYEHTLPTVIDSVYGKGKVPYIPGSPWSRDGLSASDLTTGDVHQWNVWHGQELPYQQWSKLAGRFISEFGMQALPTFQTFQDFITDASEMYPQSSTVELHNKAAGFERKLAMYTFQNIHIDSFTLKDWIYATQLMQSECLSEAVIAFRRRWGNAGSRETGGQLVWQVNDTYPVTSWAVVDYYKRPKMAYYGLKRSSELVLVGLDRVVEAVDGTTQDSALWKIVPKKHSLGIWVNNLTQSDIVGEMVLEVYHVGLVIFTKKLTDVKSTSNSTREVQTIDCDKLLSELDVDAGECIYRLRYYDSSELVGETSSWPQPLKHYPQSPERASVSVSGDQVTVKTQRALKGVYLQVEDGYVTFEDNGFDLFPGDVKVVNAPGLNAREVTVRHHFSK